MFSDESEDDFLSADEGSEAEDEVPHRVKGEVSHSINDEVPHVIKDETPSSAETATPSTKGELNKSRNDNVININLINTLVIQQSNVDMKELADNIFTDKGVFHSLTARGFCETSKTTATTTGQDENVSHNNFHIKEDRTSSIDSNPVSQTVTPDAPFGNYIIEPSSIVSGDEVNSTIISKPEFKNIEETEHSKTVLIAKPDLKNSEETVINKKLIKESKIGLKKPREKLGARLGNKKLGSRVTKPLVGISYDSIQDIPKQDGLTSSAMPSNATMEKVDNSGCVKDGESASHISKDNEKLENFEAANWGSWSDWSSTLVSAASTLSQEVSRGVGTVMVTVESSLGAPDPEVLARESVEIEKKLKELAIEKDQERSEKIEGVEREGHLETKIPENKVVYGFGFSGLGKLGSIVSGVSGAFETASNTVLQGGLETLEKIGRKTMDVIQDGDPGLKRKRAFLQSKKPNLSMVLRDARERALDEEELKASNLEADGASTSRTVSMALVWDGTEGSAHLEALSLVAKQCHIKTSNIMLDLPSLGLNKLHPIIAKIKTFSEIDEDKVSENISKDLNQITRDVQLPLQFGKLMMGWPSFEDSIKKLSIQIRGFSNDENLLIDLQKDLLDEVSLVVSHMVGVTHKAAELALITPELDYVLLVQQFKELSSCISSGLERSADQICESVTRTLPSTDSFVSSSVTNIYVQMAEANSYIQSSLQHLTTVLIQAQAKHIASEL